MRYMKIVPVLDIKDIAVVQAISGQRELYRPLWNSKIIANPNIELSLVTLRNLGFREIYIADIDSIEDKQSLDIVRNLIHILDIFDKVLIDIGRRGLEFYNQYTNIIPVIGTEYIDIDETYLLDGKTISLDMYGKYVKFRNTYLDYVDTLRILHRERIRLERVLVLDLERVGTLSGIELDKIREISNRLKMIDVNEVYYGGGIRDVEDIYELCRLGIDGVIVGTALHLGKISQPCIEC